ncbi:MAG TPA: lysophospholipase [Chitinophagales bacterium]|nr:lysophospholipase [Chitinophagales bacterium]HNL84454.1 lysophospholipase [Chitinophagales bacterium]
MKNTKLEWTSNDGLRIFGQQWEANSGEPKAVICLVHGFGEHSSRYEHVADFFTKNGYAMIAYDHRGHGRSEGKKGHFPSYDEFLNDVGNLLKQADQNFADIPKFLYGHSMGGNVVANYAIKRKPDVKGVILSSPFFNTAFEPPAIKIAVGKFMRNLIPTLSLPSGLDATQISRDKDVVEKYKKDPMVFDIISSKMGIELIEYGEDALAHAKDLKLPTLLFHGTADGLTSFEKSKTFAQKAGSNLKFIAYEGLYHETHNEPEKEMVLTNVLKWCNEQLDNGNK